MIDANKISTSKIARAYDLRSGIYDRTIAISEFTYHLKALKKINWRPGMRVLEVATGPGRVLAEIAERVGEDTTLYGLDLSQKMLTLSQKRLDERGFRKYELKKGDCRQLPWPDEHFDLLYNGYMLDLIPYRDMNGILKEFLRVLKPGGQLILLNMSNQDDKISFLERLYVMLPKFLALYLMGNCRPVRMKKHVVAAGFQKVEREYLSGRHPSEIVTAIKEAR
jgi:demethylmenaquinone methyltransferase/2-methoxy-6-polyprenyl-1,4-benzoquinol methylase